LSCNRARSWWDAGFVVTGECELGVAFGAADAATDAATSTVGDGAGWCFGAGEIAVNIITKETFGAFS